MVIYPNERSSEIATTTFPASQLKAKMKQFCYEFATNITGTRGPENLVLIHGGADEKSPVFAYLWTISGGFKKGAGA